LIYIDWDRTIQVSNMDKCPSVASAIFRGYCLRSAETVGDLTYWPTLVTLLGQS